MTTPLVTTAFDLDEDIIASIHGIGSNAITSAIDDDDLDEDEDDDLDLDEDDDLDIDEVDEVDVDPDLDAEPEVLADEDLDEDLDLDEDDEDEDDDLV